MTTSTHGALWRTSSRSFWVAQPPTTRSAVGVAILPLLELAQVAVHPVVGSLSNGAGVDEHHIRVLEVGRRQSCHRPRTDPAIRSESCSFIWQPKVRMKYDCPGPRRVTG